MDTELRQVNTNNEALKQNHLELKELKEVLDRTQTYFAVVCTVVISSVNRVYKAQIYFVVIYTVIMTLL